MYNIVAIGGTGARCVEALVHLCAAGLGPQEPLFILIVDTDTSNGNILRLADVIHKYQECRNRIESPIFRTEIVFSKETKTNKDYLVWSPAKREESLRDYLKYNTLTNTPSLTKLADICNLLYSPEEIDLKWDRGFCGRASIGAPVMARIKENFKRKPWSDIVQNLENDLGSTEGNGRLFVFASIFGAAGASGFPVVAEVLRDKLKKYDKLLLGGGLLLPYFSFRVPPSQTGPFASPKDFFSKAKSALEYYSDVWAEGKSPYNAIYLAGEKGLDGKEGKEDRQFALGQRGQKNFAHYIELLAALSSLHFHGSRMTKGKLSQFGASRSRERIIEWGDLPCTESNLEFERRLSYFTTFAVAYQTFYSPLLMERRFTKRPHLATWLVDNFHGNPWTDEEIQTLKTFGDYFKRYLEWWYEMASSTRRDLRLFHQSYLELLKRQQFCKLDDMFFSNLSCSRPARHRHGYDVLWDLLCNTQLSESESPTSPTGRLMSLLFKATASFCRENYSYGSEE